VCVCVCVVCVCVCVVCVCVWCVCECECECVCVCVSVSVSVCVCVCVCVCVWCVSLIVLRVRFLRCDRECKRLDVWSCRCMILMKHGPSDATYTFLPPRRNSNVLPTTPVADHHPHSLQPWSGNVWRLPPSVLKRQ